MIMLLSMTDLRKYGRVVNEGAALSAVALMEDRILMENGRKQKYGSQLRSQGDGPLLLYPVEDPEHVNERRAAMGLETIEAYLKRFGIDYKPEQN